LKVKLSDFGLSKSIDREYYRSTANNALPIRWSPPEVIRRQQFSYSSDRYSFGVTIWEIFTKGQYPFQLLSNEEIYQKMMDKATPTLSRPPECLEEEYQLIVELTDPDPSKRPLIAEVVKRLSEVLNKLNPEKQQSISTLDNDQSYVVVPPYVTPPEIINKSESSRDVSQLRDYAKTPADNDIPSTQHNALLHDSSQRPSREDQEN